ncbi:hypothetical protein V7112_07455 [Bacillus sp. JJ1566]|uniref:hypothetical protein n=1 Tax=Bacillus sp. JJ1566 TaxID=3122961 RepID=UPI002FFDB6E8
MVYLIVGTTDDEYLTKSSMHVLNATTRSDVFFNKLVRISFGPAPKLNVETMNMPFIKRKSKQLWLVVKMIVLYPIIYYLFKWVLGVLGIPDIVLF